MNKSKTMEWNGDGNLPLMGNRKPLKSKNSFFCVGGHTWRCCLWAPSFSKWLVYTILLLKDGVEFIKETTLFPLMPPLFPPNQLHNVTFLQLACLTTILLSKFSWACWRNCLLPSCLLSTHPSNCTT
jgi:hypothetical protein